MTCEMNRIGDDDLQLIDISEEDDYLIAFPFRDSLEDFRLSVAFDNLNECDRGKLFRSFRAQAKEKIDHVESESIEPKRPSFLRKSLAWDSAFFTSSGVLDSEELYMINKGFKKAESSQPSCRTRKGAQSHRVSGQSQTTVNNKGLHLETLEGDLFKGAKPSIDKLSKKSKGLNNNHSINYIPTSAYKVKSIRSPKESAVKGSDSVKMENKTRKAGTAQDSTVSKRSRSGDLSGLPKSTYFTCPKTEKASKFHHKSYESCSSASSSKNFSKSIKRKINPKNTKLTNSPSLVHFPLSSICSSSTSPASSIDGWFSESLSSKVFKSQNSEERKLTSQNVTRSLIGVTPPFGGPKRKIKSSGLRMPSPKIGFFDEEPIFRGNVQDRFEGQKSPLPDENQLINKFHSFNLSPSVSSENCLKVRKFLNKEQHDGRKMGSVSCSKLKPDGQKRQKDDNTPGSFHVIEIKKKKDERDEWENQKENFEDQVNGLSRHLEVIDLYKDVVEVKVKVKGQQLGQPSISATAECRTPLAERKVK